MANGIDEVKKVLELSKIQREYAHTYMRDLVESAFEAGRDRQCAKPTAKDINNAITSIEASMVSVHIAKEWLNIRESMPEIEDGINAMNVQSAGYYSAMVANPAPDIGPQADFKPLEGALRATLNGHIYCANVKDALYSMVAMFATEHWTGSEWEACEVIVEPDKVIVSPALKDHGSVSKERGDKPENT